MFPLFFTPLLLSFSLKNLVKHLPEQDQLNALAKYENEYANLSEPEQFGVVVRINTHSHTRTHTYRVKSTVLLDTVQ